jgi:hypothetical protein
MSEAQHEFPSTERKAVLAVEGQAGGKGLIVVPETMILDGVKQIAKLADGPVTIQEATFGLAESQRVDSREVADPDSFQHIQGVGTLPDEASARAILSDEQWSDRDGA